MCDIDHGKEPSQARTATLVAGDSLPCPASHMSVDTAMRRVGRKLVHFKQQQPPRQQQQTTYVVISVENLARWMNF